MPKYCKHGEWLTSMQILLLKVHEYDFCFRRNGDGMTGRDFVLEIHETFSVIISIALIQKLIRGDTVPWNHKVSFKYLYCFGEKSPLQ